MQCFDCSPGKVPPQEVIHHLPSDMSAHCVLGGVTMSALNMARDPRRGGLKQKRVLRQSGMLFSLGAKSNG